LIRLNVKYLFLIIFHKKIQDIWNFLPNSLNNRALI
jgi:hypothetical protein